MTEQQPEYITDAMEMMGAGYDQPAAVIDPPRTVKALRDSGLADYKELKELKGANALSQSEIDQANAKVDYILANNQPEKAWAGRELIRADLLHYADWYHEVTGQVMTKRVQSAWWKALGEWKAELLDISDLQTAYTARSAWRTVTSPVELTSDAAAIHALPKVKPESSQYRIGA